MDILGGTDQIQQLVISRAISGLRIEQPNYRRVHGFWPLRSVNPQPVGASESP